MLYNPYNKIKQLEKHLEQVEKANIHLSNLYANLLEVKVQPEEIVAKVLKRGIDWYDYQKLDLAGRNSYWSDIQSVIMNESYQNEINHFIADLVKEIAYGTKSFEDVRDLRMTINGVQTLQERLESITKYVDSESTDEIYEAL